MTSTVETARNRRRVAADAGYGATSFAAVLAGTLVAFGALVVVLAAVGAVGGQLGLRTSGLSTDRWRQLGVGGAAATVAVLFGSFWFGGYTAGRMGRRNGARHGLLVALLALLALGLVALLSATLGDPGALADELDVPTGAETWGDIGVIAAAAGLLAMILGSVVGGSQGDRWHGKLMTAAIAGRRTDLEAGRGREEDHAARRRWFARKEQQRQEVDVDAYRPKHAAPPIDLRDQPSLEAERQHSRVDNLP